MGRMDLGTIFSGPVPGVALLVAAAAFFTLEAHAPGVGVPAAIGLGCTVAGTLMLMDAGVIGGIPLVTLAALTVGGVGLLTVLARAGLKAVRRPLHQGSLLGVEGIAASDLAPHGTVRVRSEEWTAEAIGEPIAAGERIIVVEEEGLRLRVIAS